MRTRHFLLSASLSASALAPGAFALAGLRLAHPAQAAPRAQVQVLAQAFKPQMKMQAAPSRIEWDARTLVRVAGGTYGRMIRLLPALPAGQAAGAGAARQAAQASDILCCYEAGGKSWVVRSRDDGRSWGEPLQAKEIEGANAANPELLQLKSGRLLLFYNQRPHPAAPQPPAAAPTEPRVQAEKLRFGIGVCVSDDGGATWRSDDAPLFLTGSEPADGCWEPAAIQLPGGEIQLFFANEAPYEGPDQEITRLRSIDNGQTWSAPENVSHRAGHRDGMPVPLRLQSGELLLAIEDNGLAPGNSLQPTIIDLGRGGTMPPVDAASERRWGAASPPLPGNVYAGAPYLRQMASGATILSCQSNEGGREKYAMTVYVGDAHARGFANPSRPFSNPSGVSGSWNSLFVKDADTITAISETVVNGAHGLWAIDGKLVPARQAPEKQ